MEDQSRQVPSLTDFIIAMLLGAIPIVGFILMIIWAVGGSNVPLWKQNYARAYFVMAAVAIVAGIVFSGTLLGIFASMMYNFY